MIAIGIWIIVSGISDPNEAISRTLQEAAPDLTQQFGLRASVMGIIYYKYGSYNIYGKMSLIFVFLYLNLYYV